ncbi:MAG TPA: DUF4331 family protein [Candidatus Baltobacteraceae bacterium]|jgi:hypothetical protein
MKRFYVNAALAAILGISIAGCGNNDPQVLGVPGGGGSPPPGTTTYIQTELFARPAVKEGLEMFMDHDATNRSEPYNDTTLTKDIGTFASTVAMRDTATTAALQQILGPDELLFDISAPDTKAAYLGVESGGATGSKFGGRALNDDVIDLDLGAVFGNTLALLKVVPDDHKESPCLTTDNVAYDKANTATFPYVEPPK